MRKCVLILLTVILMTAAHAVLADDQPPQPVQVVATVLQLSDAQVASWMQILVARQEALAPLQQQLQANQKAIEAALQLSSPDAQAIGQLFIDRKTLEMQAAGVVAGAATQFDALLTSDQRTRLQQIRAASQVCPVVPAFQATGLL